MKTSLASFALGCALATGVTGASAICMVSQADYGGGTHGTEAVSTTGCFEPVAGGAGVVSASSSKQARGLLSATANLGSGVLTALAEGDGLASATLWDTLTFQGLPAGGAMLTETLSLVGGITGQGFGQVILSAGDLSGGGFFSSGSSEFFHFDRNTVFPLSVARQFLAHNGEPILLFAGLYANNRGNNGNNGMVDLADPPTFSITVPSGVTYMSNSRVFTNVGPAAVVPEPASGALLLAGLGAACAFGQRGRLSASAA